jgi:hypothetical protein
MSKPQGERNIYSLYIYVHHTNLLGEVEVQHDISIGVIEVKSHVGLPDLEGAPVHHVGEQAHTRAVRVTPDRAGEGEERQQERQGIE